MHVVLDVKEVELWWAACFCYKAFISATPGLVPHRTYFPKHYVNTRKPHNKPRNINFLPLYS